MNVNDRNEALAKEIINRINTQCDRMSQDAGSLGSIVATYKEVIMDLVACKTQYADILTKYSTDVVSQSKIFPGIDVQSTGALSPAEMQQDGEQLKQLANLIVQLERQVDMTQEQLIGVASRVTANTAAIENESAQLSLFLSQKVETASGDGLYGVPTNTIY